MANTATLGAPQTQKRSRVRKLSALTLVTEGIKDMIEEISVDTFRLITSKKWNKQYLLLINSTNEDFFQIAVGPSVDSKKKGNDFIIDLMENYAVFSGESENGHWFTFGTNEMGAPDAEITLKELTKKKVTFYAGE